MSLFHSPFRFINLLAASALVASLGVSPFVLAAPGTASAPSASRSYADAPRVTVRRWAKTDLAVYLSRPAALADDEQWTRTQTAIRDGVSAWTTATEGRINFTWTDKPRRADITIRLVPSDELPARAAGITRTAFRSRAGTITDAQIRIDETMTGAALSAVAAHETGHALGIGGHSPDPEDLMYPRLHLPTFITPADITTLLRAYDAPVRR